MADNKSLTVTDKNYSESDIALIKQTVAKGATDAELKLFLYRAKNMGLDPMKAGQIYHVKYGNAQGTIVIGLDGFRAIAGRTGKHSGTKRGLIRDDSGKCTGAWCEVYRNDWQFPAREESSMSEYNTGKAQWLKMPETMIKKIAEVAALRMAFPDVLGDAYSEEEMGKGSINETKTRDVQTLVEETTARPEFETILADEPTMARDSTGPGQYIFKTGNSSRKGKCVSDLDLDYLQQIKDWFDAELKLGKNFDGAVHADFNAVDEYLKSL